MTGSSSHRGPATFRHGPSVLLRHLDLDCVGSWPQGCCSHFPLGLPCSVSTAQKSAGVDRSLASEESGPGSLSCATAPASVSRLPVSLRKRAARACSLLSLHPLLGAYSPRSLPVTARPCSAELLGTRVSWGLHLTRGSCSCELLQEFLPSFVWTCVYFRNMFPEDSRLQLQNGGRVCLD